jgi:hypothetical protein
MTSAVPAYYVEVGVPSMAALNMPPVALPEGRAT